MSSVRNRNNAKNGTSKASSNVATENLDNDKNLDENDQVTNNNGSVEESSDATKKDHLDQNNNKKLLDPTRNGLVLLTIRLILTLFSQRSYIHPDEFFQGVEIIAGDLFNCGDKIHRAWEFNFNRVNSTQAIQEPIRNMAIPYIFYGIPLAILKYFSSLGSIRDYTLGTANQHELNVLTVSANTLIFYPRCFMILCSFIIDIVLFNLADFCDLDNSSVLLTFASSYIAIIYLTRTFSNSIETILFSIFVYLIIKSIKSQYILNDKFLIESSNQQRNKTIRRVMSSTNNEFKINNSNKLNATNNSNNNNSENSAGSSMLSSTIKRLRLFDIYKFDYLGDSIGLVLAIGVFNRPTFLIYAFVPIFYWLFYGLEHCNSFYQIMVYIIRRLITLGRLFVPFAIFFILFDTVYFYRIRNFAELYDHIVNHDLIITPYNFFLYNTNPDNLRQHGEHPFYQHILNCFLLFGLNQLIVFIAILQFGFQAYSILSQRIVVEGNPSIANRKRSWSFKAREKLLNLYKYLINNLFCFFVLVFLVPLVVFSLISHKEPRFLLPLVVPMCLLTSHCIFGKQSYTLLKFIWIGFNFICIIVYGYAHQGGLIPSISHIQKTFTHVANIEMDQHVIFYHTYMPPRHLIAAPVSANIISNKRFIYELKKRLSDTEINRILESSKHKNTKLLDAAIKQPVRNIYDLSSSKNLNDLESLIFDIKKSYVNTSSSLVTKSYAIFLVTPSFENYELKKKGECSPNDENYLEGNFFKNRNNKNKQSVKKSNAIEYDLVTKFRLHITFDHLQDHFDYIKCKFKRDVNLTEHEKQTYSCFFNKCKSSSFIKRMLDSFSLNLYQVLL